MTADVRAAARAVAADVVALRRALHRRPEPSGAERETAAAVEKALRAAGLAPRRLTETGVIADVDGAAPGSEDGPTLLLRADMDALEIAEETGLPFASEVPGMMHACGHDAHTAMLAGAGRALAGLRAALRGRVRLLFQPSEETSPGGALPMIEAGALEGVDAAVALHVYPHIDAGKVQLSAGPQTANADDLTIEIVGRGGHAANPDEARDPVVAAAALVTDLQRVVSRRIDPLDPAVLTIGRIEAGTRRNVIPDRAVLEGTVRTFSPAARATARAAVEAACRGAAEAHGVEVRLDYLDGYPVATNDPRLTALVEAAGREALGPENVLPLDKPTMGGEDFAYFCDRVPGCLVRLGSGSGPAAARFPHHHPRFVVDESCLDTGVALLLATALRFGETWAK